MEPRHSSQRRTCPCLGGGCGSAIEASDLLRQIPTRTRSDRLDRRGASTRLHGADERPFAVRNGCAVTAHCAATPVPAAGRSATERCRDPVFGSDDSAKSSCLPPTTSARGLPFLPASVTRSSPSAPATVCFLSRNAYPLPFLWSRSVAMCAQTRFVPVAERSWM